jgi:Flp pilus assembly CpaE family ATPase
VRPILVVGASCPELDLALENAVGPYDVRVVRIERAATACARLAGGGVDLVLLYCPAIQTIASLRRVAPEVRIIACYEPGQEADQEAAVGAGASRYLPISRCTQELGSFLESTVNSANVAVVNGPVPRGSVLGLIGAKGGVGTTTLALNTASVLARNHRVLLAELRPQFGTLHYYFQTRRMTRSLAALMAAEPSALGVAQIEACLWQHPVTGLRVLFAPPGIEKSEELSASHVRGLLDSMVQLADYVVLDLPSSCSEANRTAVQLSSSLAIVLERDPICLHTGKIMIETFEHWGITPQLAGAVFVNRVALASPFDLSEAQGYLGLPTLGVIPPAPELCITARERRMPLVLCDPESLVASSIDRFVSNLRM